MPAIITTTALIIIIITIRMSHRWRYTTATRRTMTAIARPWTILTAWMASTMNSIWRTTCAHSNRARAVRSVSDVFSFPSIKHSNWNDVSVSNAISLHRNANIWLVKYIWPRLKWKSGSRIIDIRRNARSRRRVSTIRSIKMVRCPRHVEWLCRYWFAMANRVWAGPSIRMAHC